MAWLETKGTVFRIRFRFGGAKQLLALHTSDKKEAGESLARFEANLRLIERGIIDPPPDTADVGVYIVSGGKLTSPPAETPRPKRATLGMLFDCYLASFPRAAKEASTWLTGPRSKPISRDTVQKELGSLSTVWNRWGVPQGDGQWVAADGERLRLQRKDGPDPREKERPRQG